MSRVYDILNIITLVSLNENLNSWNCSSASLLDHQLADRQQIAGF